MRGLCWPLVRRRLHVGLLLSLMLATCCAVTLAAPDIPALHWSERSDWVNVKTEVTPAAVGDGVADDTAALQAGLSAMHDGSSLYLPPGTYRVTQTLVLQGPIHGVLIVGHGRDTKLVWDGAVGGTMFHSNGSAYGRYVGLSWDGRNKAAIGFEHASEKRFETEVRHQHEAYRNFTGYGIRIGYQQKVASAEINYLNCLFENCGTGVAFLAFNDYDNSFDGCEFRDCGTGLFDTHGNFYARNCHFERSRVVDCQIGSEHGSSVRRCTSYGSQRFVSTGSIAPVVIQDCQVGAWKDPAGAVHLSSAPVLMFDCAFTEPPAGAGPPVKVLNGGQRLMSSHNQPAEREALISAPASAQLYEIPDGKFGGVVQSPKQSFLRSNVIEPGRVFDAKADFGARGDGATDDTVAIQKAIDAARKAGKEALAYLPTGRYVITRTLELGGGGYRFGGSGFFTRLLWGGPEGGTALHVDNPQGLTLEEFMVGHHDLGPQRQAVDILQTSGTGPSQVTYDGVSVYGMYQKQPGKQGLLFDRLSPGSLVHGIHVQGNLRFVNSARARFLFAQSYEGTISVSGADRQRDGLLGFMFRLATITNPALDVRDNHSLVASDFYVEQADTYLRLAGAPGDPPGAITIQGAKIHTFTDTPLLDAQGYHGRVFLSNDQFYVEPKTPKFVTVGDQPLELLVAGMVSYNAHPEFALGPGTHLTMLGNAPFGSGSGVEDRGLDRPEAMATFAAALDDLRRLGRLDHEVNGWLKER